MRTLAVFLFSFFAYYGYAQTGTEILLFDLHLGKNAVTVKDGVNISNRKGYDNQPFFDPDTPLVYYTSADSGGRTDIMTYNYVARKTKNLTNTGEREYSPTVTPDKGFVSCIVQRDNGAQDLGKYPVKGGNPVVLVNNLTIGYHAWVDGDNIVVFVLGEPNTLRWISLKDKRDTILAENIGRSLHVIPTSGDISFVHKVSADTWLIKKIDRQTRKISTLGETIPGREDMTWTPDGRIVMSDGEKLFYLQPAGWTEMKVRSATSLKGITRIAINGKGDKIAVVVAE